MLLMMATPQAINLKASDQQRLDHESCTIEYNVDITFSADARYCNSLILSLSIISELRVKKCECRQ